MINVSEEARQLAEIFGAMAERVDAFCSDHFESLAPKERADLEAKVQRLEDLHDSFTADAIRATLEAMQKDLQRITAVTAMAREVLSNLHEAAAILRLVASVAKLGEAVVAGDLGAIPQDVGNVVGAFHKGGAEDHAADDDE